MMGVERYYSANGGGTPINNERFPYPGFVMGNGNDASLYDVLVFRTRDGILKFKFKDPVAFLRYNGGNSLPQPAQSLGGEISFLRAVKYRYHTLHHLGVSSIFVTVPGIEIVPAPGGIVGKLFPVNVTCALALVVP